MIVVKGPTGSFCRCGEELQHRGINDEWSVWRIPVAKHWEVPPRHDGDRAKRRAAYPNVNSAYWGEEYWGKQKQLRLDLLRNAEQGQTFEFHDQYEHFKNGYREYGVVKTIRMMSQWDWNWREPEPPPAAA